MYLFDKNISNKAVLVIALLAAFSAGMGFHAILDRSNSKINEIRQGGFQFISPLLECEEASTDDYRELRPFKKVVEKAVESHLAKKDARTISVYFRDLRNGPWLGFKEKEPFTPASMMKVPLMMTILKQAERDPSLLKKKLLYDGRDDLTQYQYFKPKDALVRGTWYTVDDLLFRMIAYSDNNATRLLSGKDGPANVTLLMAELGIPFEGDKRGEDYITVRNYTSFFRVLYNASYLNREMSEKALRLLSYSDFPGGIQAGLPPDVRLATKFGEYTSHTGGRDEYQLQELGIVYYPDHPYLLGIVVKGGGPPELANVIADLSKTIYQEVDRQQHLP